MFNSPDLVRGNDVGVVFWLGSVTKIFHVRLLLKAPPTKFLDPPQSTLYILLLAFASLAREMDGEQTNEFLGLLINGLAIIMLKPEVVNRHAS